MNRTAEGPIVSVVVPAHNAAKTLERAIDSVRRQTAAGWELIVVDDRSTDDTAATARALSSGDPRIACRESSGAGVSAARNAGVRVARGDWLLFLDADDWVAPETVERVLEAVRRDPAVDMVCYGWQRVTDRGEVIHTAHPWFGEDAFTACAGGCPLTIHACVVRTDRVRALGGFDESLATCEDWDLWMRFARAGARIVQLPQVLAFYRTSAGSASMNPVRLLDDGLRVLARAHGADPRVPTAPAALARGRPMRELPARRYSWLAWVAGYHLVAGGDSRTLLSQAPFDRVPALAANAIADMIWWSLPVAAARPVHRFVELWPEVRGGVEAFVRELCAVAGAKPFDAQVIRRIELSLLAGPEVGDRDLSRCSSRSLALDRALPDLTFPEGVEVCRLRLTLAGDPVGTVDVPVIAGRVGASDIAAAASRRRHWHILGRYFGRTLLPRLTVRTDADGSWSVRRGRTVLASGLAEAPTSDALHDLVGWTLLQQETWGDPKAAPGEFYSAGRSRFAWWRPARAPGVVDVAQRLAWRRSTGDTLTLTPRIGAASCDPVHVAARGPGSRVSPRAQRAAIVRQLGLDLSEHVVREALIGRPVDASLGIRERLRRAAATLPAAAVATDSVAVHRREPRSADPATTPIRYGRHHFESLFALERDPWLYDSPYEVTKYDQTLRLALEHAPRSALEIACAEGHFTERLAPHVRELLAADISAVAVERARERLRRFPHVSFRRLDMTSDSIEGQYDLVTCCEVLYFVRDVPALRAVGRKLADVLAVGGRLVTAHANVLADDPDSPGFDWEVPLGARTIAEVLSGVPSLRLTKELRTPYYRISVFEKRLAGSQAPAGGLPDVVEAEAPAPEPAAAAYFHWKGRAPAVLPDRPRTERLPILMYHRLADEGPDETARWRITSRQFSDQMGYLRSAGFRSVSLDAWRAALQRREPLEGRCVAITFDDGYSDFADSAWPILRAHGLQSTCYLVSARLGRSSDWDADMADSVPLMDVATVRRLHREGVCIGSHSATHRPVTSLTSNEALHEMTTSRLTLESILGESVEHFAYPFGDADEAVAELARQAGYRTAVGCRPGLSELRDDPLDLPRVEITADMSFAAFVRALGR